MNKLFSFVFTMYKLIMAEIVKSNYEKKRKKRPKIFLSTFVIPPMSLKRSSKLYVILEWLTMFESSKKVIEAIF